MDGPLSRKLAAYSDKLRELNFPFAEAYDTLVARLIDGGIGSGAPKVGEVHAVVCATRPHGSPRAPRRAAD